jgi:hypothetical protein
MPHGPFGYLLKNTAMLEGKWPSENVVIEIITWFGVIIFSFALLMFLKDVAYLTRAYFKLSRAFKRRKRNQHGCFKSMKQKICFCRARPDRSNGRIDQTKIVPSTRKPSRGRSLTSILYDDNIEASAVVQLNLSDAKRKASARLERRRTSKLRGFPENSDVGEINPPGYTRSPIRDRSFTSRFITQHLAQEQILNKRINRDRRSSRTRLMKRINGSKAVLPPDHKPTEGGILQNKKSKETDFDFV